MPVIGERPDLDINAVIFATDLSMWSQNAGFYAASLAKYFSAKLLVAHAFTLGQAAMEAEVGRPSASQQRKDLKLLLSESASRLARGALETIPVLMEGDPKKVVPDLADENAPSLIVLGTHGGGGVERALIGSTAEEILRSTPWPSFILGPRVSLFASMSFPFRRILYVTDFTPAAARAAVYAVSFAETLNADIDVLNVIPGEDVHHPERLHDLEKVFFHALDKVVPEQAREFCNPRTFVETGNAHNQILQHIRQREIDLLVLGIRKTAHLGMQMRTSGAFKLMIEAACPILTVTG